jgi:hypothetical protein
VGGIFLAIAKTRLPAASPAYRIMPRVTARKFAPMKGNLDVGHHTAAPRASAHDYRAFANNESIVHGARFAETAA